MAEQLDPSEIFVDARWLAQAHDAGSDLFRFVAMEQSDYRAASFLDDRMFEQWRDVRVLPLPTVTLASASCSRQDAGWIFHIGHVGSTLLARMLGEIENVLSVREPRILRDCAFHTNSGGKFMGPTRDKNVRLGSTAEITLSADSSSPLVSTTPLHVYMSTCIRDTSVSQRISPPKARTAFAKARVISPAFPTLTCANPPRFSQLWMSV